MPAVAPNVLRGRVDGVWRSWATPSIRWGQPSGLRGTITTTLDQLIPDTSLPWNGDGNPAERILRLLRDFVPTGIAFAELSYVGSPSAAVDGDRWYIEALGVTVERDSGSTATPVVSGYRFPIAAGWVVAANQAAQWVTPRYVWARHNDVWRVVWAQAPSAPLNPAAAIEPDGTVEITWDADDPEVVTRYEVRRSNGTLVANVTVLTGTSYAVIDPTPLPGVHAYTITPFLGATGGTAVNTNTVDIDLTPDTATVTFDSDPSPNRSAIISWTGEKPGTTSVRVKRPNGTLVGTVPAGTLTLNDNTPNAGVNDGQYLVEVIGLNGAVGGSLLTNTVDIALPPTGLVLTGDEFTRAVTLDWDETSVGEHTGFTIYGDGIIISDPEPENADSYSEVAPPGEAGKTYEYEIATRINGNRSARASFGTIDFDPNPPSSVVVAATGVLGQLRITYADPEGEFDYTEVELSNDGVTWNPGYAPAFSGLTHIFTGGSGARYMRIRSVAAHGGVSSWVAGSATPLWDNTPPAQPTITSWKPESSYGRLVVRFTTASSDNHQYRVLTSTNDGSFVVRRDWTSVGNSQAIAFAAITGTAGNKYEVRVDVRDVYGNTRIGTTIPFYTLRAEIQDILPTSSGHWRSGTFGQNTGEPTKVYQWYFSNPAFRYVGLIYYGTQWRDNCNALSSFGGKITVTGMRVVLTREGGGTNIAQCVNLGGHTIAVNPGFVNGAEPPIFHKSCAASLAYGQTAEPWLSASLRTALRDGTVLGLGIEGAPYMFLFGYDESIFQFFGKIYSLG